MAKPASSAADSCCTPSSCMSSPDWQPGLDNDDQTLAQVCKTIPAYEPVDLHWLIKLLDNPRKPVVVAGCTSLFNHDCVHILLGRGLSAQDEAFVSGFTIGSAVGLHAWQQRLLRQITANLYPNAQGFSAHDMQAFDAGYAAARQMQPRDLHLFDFSAHMHMHLGELRALLGIDTQALATLYAHARKVNAECCGSAVATA